MGLLAKIVIQFSNHTGSGRSPRKWLAAQPTTSFEVRMSELRQTELKITFYVFSSKLRAEVINANYVRA